MLKNACHRRIRLDYLTRHVQKQHYLPENADLPREVQKQPRPQCHRLDTNQHVPVFFLNLCLVGKKLTSKQKLCSISEARTARQSVAHLADSDKALNEYLKNRRPYFERGCAKYNDTLLYLNVRRIRGPAEIKCFYGCASSPHFIKKLRGVLAPQSNKKVCQGFIKVIDFLIERFCASGPNNYLKVPKDKKNCDLQENSLQGIQRAATGSDNRKSRETTAGSRVLEKNPGRQVQNFVLLFIWDQSFSRNFK